jgi:transcriptional regulator with XRE-family HTH domain
MDAQTILRTDKLKPKVREAGRWLRELREERGLTQRELARRVGAEYYTIVSQLEAGRGRVPPDHYLIWADAFGVEPREFALKLAFFYDYGLVLAGMAAGAHGNDIREPAPPHLSSAGSPPETD